MADVKNSIDQWSNTTGSNLPTDATTIGAGLADNLQEIQGVVVRAFRHKGSDIASAGTADLGGTEGLYHDITGTATITSFGTTAATGQWKLLQFDGALQITYNATSMILPGNANITTAAGDMACVIHEGSGNWRMLWYTDDSVDPALLATATSANTASALVQRDGSGNFSAGTITATLTGNVSGTAANVTGTVAIANGGTDGTTAASGFNNLAAGIVAAKGDLIAASSGSATGNLGVGSNNTVLMADSGQTYGIKWATIAEGTALAAASVDASTLKTTTEEDSITSSGTRELSYSGGFLFYPRQKEDSSVGVGGYSYRIWLNNDLSTDDTYFHCYHATYDGFGTQFMNFTYVQTSPPYSFGQGDVPLFVYVVLDSLGKILNIKSSQDPPWINDRVKPDFYENGKGYKRVKGVPLDKSKLADPAQRQQHLDAWRNSEVQNVEVTREFKNTYMAERPRPGIKLHDENEVPIPIATHGLVHPVGPIALDLREMMDEGESPGELIHNYMEIDNVPAQGVNGPPGVPILNVRWKNNP